MWTLGARYYPQQMGQADGCTPCRSLWWLLAAGVAGAGATWALTGKKKKKETR